MNTDHRDIIVSAFRRSKQAPTAVARASVALPLTIVAVALIGLGLIEYGLWPHDKGAAIVIGILVAGGMPRVFAAVWRTRE